MFFSYIDPGTGSMLFTVFLGIITTLFFFVRGIIYKIRVSLSSKKIDPLSNKKIPYVIYSDSKRYWNTFEPICDEMEKRKAECEYWTSSPDDPALSKSYKYVKCSFIGEGNKAFAKLNVMNADICLSTTPGLDVLQWKRSKDTNYYIHIYHAVDDGLRYRMFGLDYYDAVLYPSLPVEKNIRQLEKIRNLKPKDLVPGGLVYFDQMQKRLDGQNKKKNDSTTTVLLAPSWGNTSILNRYGIEIISALANTGYNVIVRPHPQSFVSDSELMIKLQQESQVFPNVSWNRDNDNFNVLQKSDIMISDFSGVMFDFSLIFNKPIIYADVSFDKSVYDAAWLAACEILDCLPMLGKQLERKDFPEIKRVIDSVITSSVYNEGRKQVKDLMWVCQGKAAETIVDYMIAHRAKQTEQEDRK